MNDDAPGLLRVARGAVPADVVAGKVGNYQAYHEAPAEQRQRDYATMVNAYFDLATDFYEFGWGQSFHFAPRPR